MTSHKCLNLMDAVTATETSGGAGADTQILLLLRRAVKRNKKSTDTSLNKHKL